MCSHPTPQSIQIYVFPPQSMQIYVRMHAIAPWVRLYSSLSINVQYTSAFQQNYFCSISSRLDGDLPTHAP
jgi:hypothetical protein